MVNIVLAYAFLYNMILWNGSLDTHKNTRYSRGAAKFGLKLAWANSPTPQKRQGFPTLGLRSLIY